MTTAVQGISGSAGYTYRINPLDKHYLDEWVFQPADTMYPPIHLTVEDSKFAYVLAAQWTDEDLTFVRKFTVPLPNEDHLRQFMRYIAHEISAGRLYPYPFDDEVDQWRRTIRHDAQRVITPNPGRVTLLYDHPTGKHEDDN